MGIAFEAPLALALLIPALILTIGLHAGARRRMGTGRRRAALILRTVVLTALVFAIAGFQLVLPVDRLATVFVVDLSDSVGNAGRSDALAFLRETLKVKPPGDVAGIVAFGKDALVERLPSELEEIDRIASAPVKSATDIGAALRLATALFPDDAQKRIVLLSDGNDTTGVRPGRGRPCREPRRGDRDAPDRHRRRRGGARRAAHDAVDRAPRRVDRGRRGDPLVGRPAGGRLPVRGRHRGRLAAGQARGRHHPGHVRHQADRGRLPHVPGPRGGRARHVQRERPGGLQHDRQGRAEDPCPRGRRRGRGRTGPGAREPAPAGRHHRARGAADRLRRPRDLRQRRAGRRAAHPSLGPPAGGAAGLRPRSRQGPGDGRRPGQLRGRWLPEDAARGDAAGRHGRARPAEAAGHRAGRRDRRVGLDGRLPLQHVRTRQRQRDRRRPEGRHRQGGDPARRGRDDRTRRAGRGQLQRGRSLGRPDPAPRRRRRPAGPDQPASGPTARRTSSRASTRPCSRSRGSRRPAATSSC